MSDIKVPISYGWYSQKQAGLAGTVLYRTPDGKEVEVSMVSRTMDHGAEWDDVVYVGQVTSFIRELSKGWLDDFPYDDE